ncbi:MAG: UV DNA damage repair endonuclease UvsE [Candidatus Auribacterota bacterium]|jgi:UV DNA damage endonuclease|nr:UV DNA damage repair endonuclease UvsE [Candidatus Auribacterota bacterium]
MKIGYYCKNWTLDCNAGKTFELSSFTEERLLKTTSLNIEALEKILQFNATHNLLVYRISSELVPHASNPVCTYPWQDYFQDAFESIGSFIKKHNMRICMHPDQLTYINTKDESIFEKSALEILYHAQVLDLMKLDESAKIVLFVGGIYGDKEKSMERFVERVGRLNRGITRRLAIENDERNYDVSDCLAIHEATGIPVMLDVLNDEVNPSGMPMDQLIKRVAKTWDTEDGIPIIEYSEQWPGERVGRHSQSISLSRFKEFLSDTQGLDYDVIMEVDDTESSAIEAVKIAKSDSRFFQQHNLTR